MIMFTIPIKTINEANGSHGHWAAKAARRKKQREAARACWLDAHYRWRNSNRDATLLSPPYMVKLTRVSAGLLDTDALPLSLKSIRDQIADELGVTDGPTDLRVSWEYAQRRGKRGFYAVEVEIRAAAGCPSKTDPNPQE